MPIPTTLESQVICKTERIKKELFSGNLDIRLFAVLIGVCTYAWAKYGQIPTITEIFCDRPGINSVHEYWRGVDLVFRGLGRAEHRDIRDWINANFPYGKPGKNTCKYHDAGTGYHLHLQVRAL